MKPSPDENPPVDKPIRLQRFLAQCGLGSRRDCEELISSGRIEIDGQVVQELGSTVDPFRQAVMLDGERLKVERKRYFVLNKPPGYLCTAKDPAGRPVVLDLFPNQGPRLFTVGRLDENTTGLLIVTNDGDLAQKLAHPRYRIYRLYRAQVAGDPQREVLDQLKTGLYFTEGKFRVHDVRRAKKQGRSTWVEITMTEGQNREIRRLFARVGHKVMKLERIGYGPIRLGKLSLGEFRELRHDELQELHGILERNERERRPNSTSGKPKSRSVRQGSEARRSEAKGSESRGAEARRPETKGAGTRSRTRPPQEASKHRSGGPKRASKPEGERRRESGPPDQKRPPKGAKAGETRGQKKTSTKRSSVPQGAQATDTRGQRKTSAKRSSTPKGLRPRRPKR